MISLILPFFIFYLISYFLIKNEAHLYLTFKSNSYYIEDEPFPTDIEFEILRKSSLRSFLSYYLGSNIATKTGDPLFDNQFFISSDYKSVVKAISSSADLQRLISLILSFNSVHSIVIKNDTIRAKLKNKNSSQWKKTRTKLDDVSIHLKKFKTLLSTELDLFSKTDFLEDKETAKKNGDFIKKGKAAYIALLISSVGQYFYTNIKNEDSVMLIDNFSFFSIITWGFFFFLPITFYVWFKLFGTVRIHLFYWDSVFLLLPACFAISYNSLYSINLIFDKSEAETFQVTHSVRAHRGKGVSYYYSFKNYPDEGSYFSGIKTGAKTYYRLKDYNKSKITVKEGRLNVRYIVKVEPIKPEDI